MPATIRHRSRAALLVLAAAAGGLAVQQVAPSPAIDDVIGLRRAGAPALSADGSRVAFTVRETNWDDNAYETEIRFADASGGEARQLTNAPKSSQQPAWDLTTTPWPSCRTGTASASVLASTSPAAKPAAHPR
ncbi:MAG: hypothetical protein R2712_09850 [Vicinamibacterales bacterium]